MTTFVDSRFAGGSVTVATVERFGQALVVLDLPGATVEFFPHEAIHLASALLEQACTAIEREVLSLPLADVVAAHDRDGVDRPISGDEIARLREELARL